MVGLGFSVFDSMYVFNTIWVYVLCKNLDT